MGISAVTAQYRNISQKRSRTGLPSHLLTLDFEASCLPRSGRSYPIEVGVSDLDGTARSWLIRPSATWRDWHWSADAEALHGISRQQLETDGLPVETVLAELASATEGAWVVADSYLDAQWLRTLAEAADMEPPFRLDHVALLFDLLETTPADMTFAEGRMAAANLRRHRAREDAQRLSLLVGGLIEASEARRNTLVSRAA